MEARGRHLVEGGVLVAVDRLDLVGAVPPEGGVVLDQRVAELVRALLVYAEVGVLEAQYVELEALMDLICVVSSCPFGLAIPDWLINSEDGITELIVEVKE